MLGRGISLATLLAVEMSSNFSVKRDCGTGVASPASLVHAAAPYLQR